jgi:S-ribosylhomocysteine lyase LuxS involved in autoinducer biosynthesis
VNGVKICKDGFYICVVRMKDEEDIVDITEMVYVHVLFC